MRARHLASALLLTAAPALADDAAIPVITDMTSMEARVQGCVTCHGQEGQGTQDDHFPRIAGKPAGYLYNQLVAFRDGTRRYAPMNYLVAYLPDAYLKEMAQYYARMRPPFAFREPTKADPALVDRGKAIVTAGDGAKQLPACVACHGAGLTGMEPGVPGLVGLRPNYVAAQLTRWRTGERRAADPDCMKRIATRLAERDVAAVAAYMALQNPPADCVARGDQPRAHADGVRQPAMKRAVVAIAVVVALIAGFVAWKATHQGYLPGGSEEGHRSGEPHDAGDPARRVPRARRRLRGLPHRAHGQALRGRPPDGHALRRHLRPQHHARRRDRHRTLDRRRLLPDDAHRCLARRDPALSRRCPSRSTPR
jgi:cytochrome c553